MSKSVKKATPIRFHEGLQQLRKDAGGMDIGASEIWVDVGLENDSEPVRRFETFTADLNRMAEWLIDCGIKSVVMESTGVYWIPACQILEDKGIEVLLVNPRYAKNVSGRKSDALDCQWLRTLHCYGLLPASFRPMREIVTLRSYLRHRQSTMSARPKRTRMGRAAQLHQRQSNQTRSQRSGNCASVRASLL